MQHSARLLKADRKAKRNTKRHDDLKWVKDLLMDWADREARMMSQSVIGYHSKSVEGRMMSPDSWGSGATGSLCPEVMMTRRISHCDQAVKALTPELRRVVKHKYEIGGTEADKISRYKAETGESERSWYRRVDKTHKAVADWIWRNCDP